MKRQKGVIDLQKLEVHEVLDKWVARSRWWSKDERRVYFRLHTSRGIIEVYRRNSGWFISRVAD
jgi:hypothetical protein